MMPTKRRILIFLIVLAVMMTAKYVWGQDADQVGWDSTADCWDCGQEAFAYGQFAMVGGPMMGILVGLAKVYNRHMAAQAGALFSGEMVRLKL